MRYMKQEKREAKRLYARAKNYAFFYAVITVSFTRRLPVNYQ